MLVSYWPITMRHRLRLWLKVGGWTLTWLRWVGLELRLELIGVLVSVSGLNSDVRVWVGCRRRGREEGKNRYVYGSRQREAWIY